MAAPPDPTALSRYLRTGDDPDLRRRRRLIGLSAAGALIGQVVGLYQTGIIRHLPDPPVGPFDSDRVDAAAYAYKRAATPDGLQMVVTYAITAALAGAGGPDRPGRRPLLPLAMAAKIAVDLVTCVVLAKEEWAENEALCAWCQAATGISAASLAIALPEARRALAALRSGRS